MYEYIKNPALIHEGPPRSATSMLSKPRVPLILVHDGGGTSFSYHLLDRINRPLYGIENAKLHDGGWWDGGVPEMAAHYVSLLGKILPEGGDILLGGMYCLNHLPTYLPSALYLPRNCLWLVLISYKDGPWAVSCRWRWRTRSR